MDLPPGSALDKALGERKTEKEKEKHDHADSAKPSLEQLNAQAAASYGTVPAFREHARLPTSTADTFGAS